MSWKELVPGCFGAVDRMLAVHPMDKKRTEEMVAAARADGATLEDVEKEIVWDVYKHVTHGPSLKPHIDQQLDRLRGIAGKIELQ